MSKPLEGVTPAEVSLILQRVLAERGAARLDAIIDSPDPGAVVGAMTETEAFYTFATLDEEGKRSMVPLLTSGQLEHLLDLDLWAGDRLDAERAMDWLERLWSADDELAVSWMRRAETELVAAILTMLCTVTEGPPADGVSLTEAQDTLPSFTAEGVYYVRFESERASTLLRGPLILLAGTDIEYYLALLNTVQNGVRSQIEELAYRERWSRLRDLGFVPADEAYGIYRWPTAGERKRQAQVLDTGERLEAEPEGLGEAPTALVLVEPRGLAATALGGLDVEQRRALSRSVAVTSALVLAADHLPFGDIDAHRRALEKTLAYVNIGLCKLAGQDADIARDLLVEQGAKSLFRVGYAEVAALGRRAYRLLRQRWLSQIGLGIELLDPPLEDVVRALARPRPLYPAAALDGEKSDRDFREPSEVERCADLLSVAEALKRLFIDGLGLDLVSATTFDLEGCQPPDPAELTLGLILRSAMAEMLLRGHLRYAPVAREDLGRLVEALGQIEGQQLIGSVSQTLAERLEHPNRQELERLEQFVGENYEVLSSSLGGLDPERPPDPRFIGAVVVRDV